MPTSQEMKVQNTFDKAMDQINNLQKVGLRTFVSELVVFSELRD